MFQNMNRKARTPVIFAKIIQSLGTNDESCGPNNRAAIEKITIDRLINAR